MHCRTCKWWDRETDFVGYANVGTCQSPKVRFAIGAFLDESDATGRDMVALDDKLREPTKEDEAAVMDGSGYFAALRPGPDFGCVHHEPK